MSCKWTNDNVEPIAGMTMLYQGAVNTFIAVHPNGKWILEYNGYLKAVISDECSPIKTDEELIRDAAINQALECDVRPHGGDFGLSRGAFCGVLYDKGLLLTKPKERIEPISQNQFIYAYNNVCGCSIASMHQWLVEWNHLNAGTKEEQ